MDFLNALENVTEITYAHFDGNSEIFIDLIVDRVEETENTYCIYGSHGEIIKLSKNSNILQDGDDFFFKIENTISQISII